MYTCIAKYTRVNIHICRHLRRLYEMVKRDSYTRRLYDTVRRDASSACAELVDRAARKTWEIFWGANTQQPGM